MENNLVGHHLIAQSSIWLLTHGLKILGLLAFGWIGTKLLKRFKHKITDILREAVAMDDARESTVRADTLGGILHTTTLALFWGSIGMMLLGEIGVQVGPLLAGVGVAGLAVGFGAQNLVKDVVTGFFILLENQYGVGDVVKMAGVGGYVEHMNLRFTKLRDLDGAVHFVPHGAVALVSNLTKEWSRSLLDIGIDYAADPEKTISILKDECRKIKQDAQWKEVFLEEPQAPGIEKFDDSAVVYRIIGMTKPMLQWDAMRELRLRILKRLNQEGIEIPFPQRTLNFRAANEQIVIPAQAGIQKR